MGRKTSKTVKRKSGSIATVVWLSDRRSLGTCVHGKQIGSADVLPFPLKRLDHRRPSRGRDALALLPLLNRGAALADIGCHFSDRSPGIKESVKRSHAPQYVSDELSAQVPPMIPVTVEAPIRTIRPTMGRNVTPIRFRAEMAKRLEAARRMAGFATKREAASMLGIGLDRYEKWESGRTPVPAQYIGPVCELYGVDANYLFGTQPRAPSRQTA